MMELSKMMVLCTKCGIDTEQNFIGIEVYSCRIASRCTHCRSTNFSEPERKPRTPVRQQSQISENIGAAKTHEVSEAEWSEGDGQSHSEEYGDGDVDSWEGRNGDWKKAEEDCPDSIY